VRVVWRPCIALKTNGSDGRCWFISCEQNWLGKKIYAVALRKKLSVALNDRIQGCWKCMTAVMLAGDHIW
jgi:hypothetical protein